MKLIADVGSLIKAGLICLIIGLVAGFALACSTFDDLPTTSGPAVQPTITRVP